MAASEEEASWRARLRRRISSLLLSTWSLDAIFFLPPRKAPMQVHMSCAALPMSPICVRWEEGGRSVFLFCGGGLGG